MSSDTLNDNLFGEEATGLPEEGKPDYLGHRRRLKERFDANGADNFPDYEFLELFLFRAIPRRDTKALAKLLIREFGSFSEVVSASKERLLQVSGVGPETALDLKLVQSAAVRLAQIKIRGEEVLSSWAAVLDYCRVAMAYETREQFRIIFLDKKNRIINDEVQQRGTVDHTPVYEREIIKRALELSATALILVHNHPSGDPQPSRADIDMTKKIVDAAGKLGITIHDHLIIGKEGHASFRGLGLM